jgi:hypothetical protein
MGHLASEGIFTLKTKKKKKFKKPIAKKVKKQLDPNVEEVYWDKITFYCPIRKKMITQKIQVKKYKSLNDIVKTNRAIIVTPDPLADIEQDDDGLTIYGDTTEAEDD